MKSLSQRIKNSSTVRGLQAFQLLRYAGFFLTGILLTKSVAGTALIGTYETWMFLSAATGFFWVSGILNSLLAHYASTKDEEQPALLQRALLLLLVFNILLVILLKLGEATIIHLTGEEIRPFYNLLLIYIFLNNPSYLTEYILLLRKQSILLLIYGSLTFIGSVLITIIPFYTGGSLADSLNGLIFLAALKSMLSFLLLRRQLFKPIDSAKIKIQLLLALPLISGLFISGSADYVDGFLVSSQYGPEAFAYFRYGAREFPLSLVMANALSMAMVPSLTSNLKEGMQELKKESGRLSHLLFLPLCLLMLFSYKLYPLVFRAEFSQSAAIFNIYLLLLISRMIFPQTVVMALQRNDLIFKTSLIELTANIFFSVVLMQWFGIAGVAYGTVIAFFTEKAVLISYLNKKYGISPAVYTNLKTWSIYSFFLMLSYFLGILFL